MIVGCLGIGVGIVIGVLDLVFFFLVVVMVFWFLIGVMGVMGDFLRVLICKIRVFWGSVRRVVGVIGVVRVLFIYVGLIESSFIVGEVGVVVVMVVMVVVGKLL